MRPQKNWLVVLIIIVIVLAAGGAAFLFFSQKSNASNIDVTTYHYDNARTGADTSESVLTPHTVTPQQFGKLFSVPVDGQIYAQPLYVNGVLFIATMHDSVYAVDATSGVILWQKNFTDPKEGLLPILAADIGFTEIGPDIGILGTPVIDKNSNTIYFVTNTRKAASPRPIYTVELHALDLTTGAEKFNGPTIIASPSGTTPAFIPIIQNQRPALLLWKGNVYIAWSSYGDAGSYHGWVMAYDAGDISKQSAVLDVDPTGEEAGIWMSGGGLSADDNSIYVGTGNGTFSPAQSNYGDSLLKLSGDLSALDYFAPSNQDALSANDEDFDATEPIIIPSNSDTNNLPLVIASDKTGKIFILNRNSLGQFSPNANNDVQDIFTGAMVMNNMAFWNGYLYVGPNNAPLMVYSLQDGYFSETPVSETSFSIGDGATNGEGTNPIVSADGTNNGIVWAQDNSGYLKSGPPILYAIDALNLQHVLWSSNMDPSRDAAAAPAVKFTAPLVVNGMVYVAGDGALTAYGMLH